MILSENIRNISPDPFCQKCADEAMLLETLATKAELTTACAAILGEKDRAKVHPTLWQALLDLHDALTIWKGYRWPSETFQNQRKRNDRS